MNKLFFLAGLIMVTVVFTGCKSDDIDAEVRNFSLAYTGGDLLNPELALCETRLSDGKLQIILDKGTQTFYYELSRIREDCMDDVKKGNVTLCKTDFGLVPVTVSKDESPNNMYGSFIFTSILNDVELQRLKDADTDQQIGAMADVISMDNALRMTYVRGLFNLGLCKPGMRMFEKGEFFFGKSDLDPEITDKTLGSGNFSPTMGFDNVLRLIQTKITKKEVIVRMEDGKTFRYPRDIFPSSIDEYSIGAGEVAFGWFPAVIEKQDGYYILRMLNNDKFYGFGNKFEELKNENVSKFLQTKGFEAKPNTVLY